MLKSILSVGIGMVLLLPTQSIKSGTKKVSLLNLNQPYQDQWEKDGNKRIPFIFVDENPLLKKNFKFQKIN